jgi:hypothetical protein
MPHATRDPEWDRVWDEYDRRGNASVATRPAPAPESAPASPVTVGLVPGHGHSRRFWLPALVLLLFPGQTQSVWSEARPAAAAPASLSPLEAVLPPLDATIARLAAESPAAACWVAQLRPGGDCR